MVVFKLEWSREYLSGCSIRHDAEDAFFFFLKQPSKTWVQLWINFILLKMYLTEQTIAKQRPGKRGTLGAACHIISFLFLSLVSYYSVTCHFALFLYIILKSVLKVELIRSFFNIVYVCIPRDLLRECWNRGSKGSGRWELFLCEFHSMLAEKIWGAWVHSRHPLIAEWFPISE